MSRTTQCDRILRLLEDAGGYGVSARTLSTVSLSYTRRIFELRALGWGINRKEERKEGIRLSRYFLVKRASIEGTAA